MTRHHAALAVLIAGVLATGCGSEDKPKTDDSKPAAPAAGQAGKKRATKRSARAKLVACIEDAGFDVSHKGQDAETATQYTVTGGTAAGKQAVVKIHSNRDEARRATARAGALNSVPFGRAELIAYAATNSEAGAIANCVSGAYGT